MPQTQDVDMVDDTPLPTPSTAGDPVEEDDGGDAHTSVTGPTPNDTGKSTAAYQQPTNC